MLYKFRTWKRGVGFENIYKNMIHIRNDTKNVMVIKKEKKIGKDGECISLLFDRAKEVWVNVTLRESMWFLQRDWGKQLQILTKNLGIFKYKGYKD